MSLETKDTRRFVSIRDGEIKEKVSADTEGAKLYEYELRDGTKGSKYEITYKSISGIITDVSVQDGEYGTNLNIAFDFGDGGETVTLSLNTSQTYGEDVMKKLPNINFEEFVVMSPYNFTDEKGKLRKGMTITQGDTKIQNFFYDADAKKAINGFPEPVGDTTKYTKAKWKTYFSGCTDFLVDYTNEHTVRHFKEKKENF